MKTMLAVVVAVLGSVTVGCGGPPFSAAEVGSAPEASQDPPETSSPEASREAGDGHDAAAVGTDAEAGQAPEEAGTPTSSTSSGGSTGSSGSGTSSGSSSGSVGTSSSSSGSSSSSSGASSGSVGPCSGGPYVTHQDGAGQTWQDCAPLGTYDAVEAAEACDAFCTAGGYGPCTQGTTAAITAVYGGACPSPFVGKTYAFCTVPGPNGRTATGWSVSAGDVVGVVVTTGSSVTIACSDDGTWE